VLTFLRDVIKVAPDNLDDMCLLVLSYRDGELDE
jgi:hypothetical protein